MNQITIKSEEFKLNINIDDFISKYRDEVFKAMTIYDKEVRALRHIRVEETDARFKLAKRTFNARKGAATTNLKKSVNSVLNTNVVKNIIALSNTDNITYTLVDELFKTFTNNKIRNAVKCDLVNMTEKRVMNSQYNFIYDDSMMETIKAVRVDLESKIENLKEELTTYSDEEKEIFFLLD